MAIKGWTNADRLPRLGQIALGIKDEKGIPKAVDYFVVPPEVQEVYGPQPKELDILIPNENIDIFFPAYLKRYGDQYGLICRGNGETAKISVDYIEKNGQEYGVTISNGKIIHKETGEQLEVETDSGGKWLKYPCQYRNCKFYKAKKCTEVAILNVILYKVQGILGVYSLDTGSFNSYCNIRNALMILKGIFGKVSFIPLKLKVRMQEMHPKVGDKRIKTTKPVLYIDMGEMNFEQVINLVKSKQLPTLDILPEPENISFEQVDENEKPDLLYPNQDEELEELNNEEEPDASTHDPYDEYPFDSAFSTFKALTLPQVKTTPKGLFVYLKAACLRDPFGEFDDGELCEVWARAKHADVLKHLKPEQIFTGEIEEAKNGMALVKEIKIKESA
jgi:hypothetical protein